MFANNQLLNNNANGDPQPELPRTKAMKYTLNLSSQDLLYGCTRSIAVRANIVCNVCQGSGAENGIVIHYDDCETCNGSGQMTVIDRSVPGIIERIPRKCDFCRGTGNTVIRADRCGNCHGRKTVSTTDGLAVPVRPQSRPGKKIIYKGAGNQEPNESRGLVVVYLDLADEGFCE